ncbi:phospholipase-like protein [Tanacetum coccineum]
MVEIATFKSNPNPAESLVGRRIKVWWSKDKRLVSKHSIIIEERHKVLYDDGDEEMIYRNQELWELVKILSNLSNFEMKLMNAGRRAITFAFMNC